MIKAKISTRSLSIALKQICGEHILRISKEILDEVADEASEHAQDLYDKAIYAGEDIEGKVNVWIEEEGPLSVSLNPEIDGAVNNEEVLAFIEYGTGARASSGYINPTTKHPYWFFDGSDKDIALNGMVSPANPRMRYGEMVEIYDAKGNPTGQKEWEAFAEPELDDREGIYITKGNPANNVMAKTKEEIINRILPDIARDHGATVK